MYRISTTLEDGNLWLCALSCRIFEGYLKIANNEVVERDEDEVEIIERKRRVLDEGLIKAVHTFRAEVSATLSASGLRTPLGVLVREGAPLQELMQHERELRARAAEFMSKMRQSLIAHDASPDYAKCEVELVGMKANREEMLDERKWRSDGEATNRQSVTDEADGGGVEGDDVDPETQVRPAMMAAAPAEAAEAGNNGNAGFNGTIKQSMIEEADRSAKKINAAVKNIREQIEKGNRAPALNQTRGIARILKEMGKRGFSSATLDRLEDDLTEIKAILAHKQMTVQAKLAALEKVELMQGIEIDIPH